VSIISRRRTDFPVPGVSLHPQLHDSPALPVKKMLFPSETSWRIFFCSALRKILPLTVTVGPTVCWPLLLLPVEEDELVRDGSPPVPDTFFDVLSMVS
jgi:hypothetical protein